MSSGEKHHKLSLRAYEYADIVYRYVYVYRDAEKIRQDYGTGEQYTPLEVHTISRIEDNPGITVTEIAELTSRTKGAVSQIITKLEDKGLVRREKSPENPQRVCLFVTPKGLELSQVHKQFDDERMGDVLDRWISLFGYDTVEKFFQIQRDYIDMCTAPKDGAQSKE